MGSCGGCGEPIAVDAMGLPCPVCESLDRAVSDTDYFTAVDETTRLEQSSPAPDRGWMGQWQRVLRWFSRMEATAEGRYHDTETDHYEDEAYAFFDSCFHLKDWLKNDPAHPLPEDVDIESVVQASEPLRWCADIANASKHLFAGRYARVDPKAEIAHRHYDLSLGNTSPTTVSARFVIRAAGDERDALELARECVQAWQDFLTECRLPGEGRSDHC
jgi:hypothetical protein